MAYQDIGKIEAAQRDQLATTLAALLLHDEGTEVTSDALNKVLKAAGVTVAPHWPLMLGKSLKGKGLGDYLKLGGGSGAAPAQTSNAPAQTQAKEAAPAPPVEEEEDVDMDMGDLFG